jgi:hypothetical protein
VCTAFTALSTADVRDCVSQRHAREFPTQHPSRATGMLSGTFGTTLDRLLVYTLEGLRR